MYLIVAVLCGLHDKQHTRYCRCSTYFPILDLCDKGHSAATELGGVVSDWTD